MARRTALERRPGQRPQAPRGGRGREEMVRVSPGVYRRADGGLQRAQERMLDRGMRRGPQQFDRGVGALEDAMNKGPARWREGMAPVDGGRAYDNLIESIGRGSGEAFADRVNMTPNLEVEGAPGFLGGQGQRFEDVYRPSRNQGGRFRLSPGVYGTREQAMQQYEREMGPANIGRVAGQITQYPQQMAEGMGRRVGNVVESDYDTAREMGETVVDNNLFRGNPLRRPERLGGAAVGGLRRKLRW